MKRKKTLRWSMIRTLAVGWVLPLVLMTTAMLSFAFAMMNRQIERTVLMSTENAVEMCCMQLQEIETLSKNASYMQTIRDSYRQYREDGQKRKLSSAVTGFLNQQYKYDMSLLGAMVFFIREPEEVYYTYNTYGDNNNGSQGYNRLLYFKESAQSGILKAGETLDTGIQLFQSGSHLYMIRNLIDNSFQPYAMIVIEIDPETVFDSLDSVWGEQKYEVLIDREEVFGSSEDVGFLETGRNSSGNANVVRKGSQIRQSYQTINWEEQELTFVVYLDTQSMFNETGIIRMILLGVLVLMVPLVFMIFRFFNNKVTRPIQELTAASRKVAQGEYGYQLREDGGSEEFDYLYQAFNVMSSELVYQFETIYKEELALKDANIKALQSQINPHFLNNTLEIINWEARMGGNETVSDMISALATMLGATLNRKQSSFVTLAEELTYMDAYLYIISCRFGERFRVQRDIDESLLWVPVPILIIQPIVENAVEYGVEANRKGMVAIRIYRKENKLYIEVENDGNLTKEDRKKIDRLLQNEGSSKDDPHISLGIRNVNQRLKIIYGEDCGLSIENERENRTISTLIVKIEEKQ